MRGFVRGRTVRTVLDAALYIACRELGIPKTLKEIASVNNIKYKLLAKSYRLLITELDIKNPIVDPTKCIITVSNKVNLSEKTKRTAVDIMCHLNKEMMEGKDPMGIAAAIYIYSMSENFHPITQFQSQRLSSAVVHTASSI